MYYRTAFGCYFHVIVCDGCSLEMIGSKTTEKHNKEWLEKSRAQLIKRWNNRIETPNRYPQYNDKDEPTSCIYCGGTKFRENVIGTIDYTVCEKEIICTNCEEVVSFWAYGSYDPCFAYPTNEIL